MDYLQTFIANPSVKEALASLSVEGNNHHAYLFSGPTSIGKRTLVESFAAAYLQVLKEQLKAHPDMYVVERDFDDKKKQEKQRISVKQIRQVRERLSQSGLQNGGRVVFIPYADLLTTAAQNALLKTLEEPPKNTIIFLTTSRPERILPTIQSRCISFSLPLVDRELICKSLRDREISEEKSHELAGMAMGRPGKAFALQETERYTQTQGYFDDAVRFFELSIPERFAQIDQLIKGEKNRNRILEQLEYYETVLHDILLVQQELFDQVVLTRRMDTLSQLVQVQPMKNWADSLDALQQTMYAIRENGNIGLALESFALTI